MLPSRGFCTWSLLLALQIWVVLIATTPISARNNKNPLNSPDLRAMIGRVVRHRHHPKVTRWRSRMNKNKDALYGSWSAWSRCSRSCTQKRVRHCKARLDCGITQTQKQERSCWSTNSNCKLSKPEKNAAKTKKIEDIVYDLLYYDWSEWSACTRTCKRRRYRTCALKRWCKNTVLLEERACYVPGTSCEKRYMLTEDWEKKAEDIFQRINPDESKDKDKSSDNHVDRKPPKGKKSKDKVEAEKKEEKEEKEPSAGTYDATQCGMRNFTRPTLRIVGGQQARKGNWPWQVAITTRWKEQYCGGVLIAPQWVLTAAHCVRKKGRRRRLFVRVGEYDLSESEGTENNLRIQSDFVHEKFDIETIDSDIALLKLRAPVEVTNHINYACLPDAKDDLPINTLCYAVGWGKMKDTHLFGSDVLRQAKVPIVDRKQCQSAFEYEITENQMCAGYRKGGVDTCAGDSGGPLMCQIHKNGENRWHVYGVTSFGEGCGDKGKYGIYTIVRNFSKWIQKTLKHNS